MLAITIRLRSACRASRSTITSKARGSNGSKASSLTNTSVIRVAKLAEGYGPALNFVRLDPDEIADPLDVRMCSLVASDSSCASIQVLSKHQFLATGYCALAPSILSDVGS